MDPSAMAGDPLRGFPVGALRAEPLRAAHAEAMFDALADPTLYEFIEHGPPASVDALRERFARLESRGSPDGSQGWLNWAVVDAAGRAHGHLQATTLADGDAWIGYVFARHAHGRGHARTGVAAMLACLRDDWGVRRALASVDAANARSLALLRALGFDEADAHEAARRGLGASDRLFVRATAPSR